MKVNIISLGCPKNLVDSEVLAGILKEENYKLVNSCMDADIVVLNTCSFISSARKEAKSYINKLIKLKKEKKYKLIVTGCLPELEGEQLSNEYPQIDVIVGISEYEKLPQIIKNLNGRKVVNISRGKNFVTSSKLLRVVSTRSYAYLKIADGCNNKCSYCLIPTIKGPYRERTMEDLIKEAEGVASSGRKEIILISQDTTLYGIKIYKRQVLHKLIEKLSKIRDLLWIRILYTHPAHFYDALIKEIASNAKVCKYVDIPIQHTSDKILSLMNRKINRKELLEVVEKLKKNNIKLRTTIMVGFPGESEQDFKILYNDVKNIEFDWLGVFKFSAEKGTAAHEIDNKVPQKVKEERYREIMSLQQKITYMKNVAYVNKTYPILVDGEDFGHTEFQCPEIDGKTFLSEKPKNVVENRQIKKVVNIYDLVA